MQAKGAVDPAPAGWGAALALLTLAALLLRLAGLDQHGLWYDEIAAWDIAVGSFREALEAETTNPPLFFALLNLWMGAVGTSEATLRMLSVIPSVAAVPLAGRLGARLYGPAAGLAAAALLAVSPFHLYYAQEVRCFAWLALLLLLAATSLERALDPARPARALPWVGYVAASLAALLCHFIAVFYVAGMALLLPLRWRESRDRARGWLVAHAAIGLAYLPWIVHALLSSSGVSQLRRYLWLKPAQAVFSFTVGDTLVPLDAEAAAAPLPTLAAHAPQLALVGLAFALLAGAALREAPRRPRASAFVACAGLVPMLLVWLASFGENIFDERYLIGSSIPLYLFLGSGLAGGAPRALRFGGGALLAGALAWSLLNYFADPRFGREQWRETAAYLDERLEPGDALALLPGFTDKCFDYYPLEAAPTLVQIEYEADVLIPETWEAGLAALRQHEAFWVVRARELGREEVRALEALTRVESHHTFVIDQPIDVYRMRWREPRPEPGHEDP